MTAEDRYAELMKQLGRGLETYIKEVAVATLTIGNDLFPGLRTKPSKHITVGKRYYVIPVDPEDRK